MSIIMTETITLPTDLEQLVMLEAVVAELLASAPAVEDAEAMQYNIVLALHELCVNIIKHAYEGQPGEFQITLALYDSPSRLVIDSYDRGTKPFSLASVAEPDLVDPPINGLGIFLMRQLMDTVQFDVCDGVNHWRITKQLSDSTQNLSHSPAA